MLQAITSLWAPSPDGFRAKCRERFAPEVSTGSGPGVMKKRSWRRSKAEAKVDDSSSGGSEAEISADSSSSPSAVSGCSGRSGRSERSRRSWAEPKEAGPPSELFGNADAIAELVKTLRSLPAMDKVAMSGKCVTQTKDMESFMKTQVGMNELKGRYFVQGVRAFDLTTPLANLPTDKELAFQGMDYSSKVFKMTVGEVLEWQKSYRAFYASDVYTGQEGLEMLRSSLQGRSSAGKEAWAMKFAVRVSENPVIMRFDGKVLHRTPGGAGAAGKIYLVSVCGIDFAGRLHDIADITQYVSNWREVYELAPNGAPVVFRGRDFVPTGVAGKLNKSRCMHDLKKMARLRLRAQDSLGIQVAIEVGLGLGVFAGDAIGIGGATRVLSALAVREVLEEEDFSNIKLVVFSLPIFRRSDNYQHFQRVFGAKSRYAGKTPVLLMDQDMHAIALAASAAGYSVGELNPADSHGVFGEYWQNMGPGTEEKLALTTCGLLTQHHVTNPYVLDTDHYTAVSTGTRAK